MLEEKFDEGRLMETAELFSKNFEDPSRFVYHGTSTLFANEIETNGFQYPFSAVPEDDLRALADSLPAGMAELAKTLRDAAKPTRLGFAPMSYAAVDYALTGGGQVVRLYKQGVDAGGCASPTMAARLSKLADAEPCVYVVDLSDPVDLDLAFDGIFVQSAASVPASRIVAKMLIPRDFAISRLKALQAIRPLFHARGMPGALVAKLKRA